MLAHAFSTARTQVAPSLFAKNLGAAVWMRPFHRENPPPRQNGRGAFMRCHGCLLRCAKIQSGWRSAPTVRRYRVHHSLHLKLAVHRPDHFGRVDAYLPAGQLIEGSGGQQALTWSRVAPRRSRRSNALFETGTCIPFSEVPAYWTRTLTHCLDGLGFVCNFNGVVADRPV